MNLDEKKIEGLFFGEIFTNSSGHPGRYLHTRKAIMIPTLFIIVHLLVLMFA
jgi:hypothetical protein